MKNYTIEASESVYELLSQEDVKEILAKFFACRAINEANKIWHERGYTEETMESWLNEE